MKNTHIHTCDEEVSVSESSSTNATVSATSQPWFLACEHDDDTEPKCDFHPNLIYEHAGERHVHTTVADSWGSLISNQDHMIEPASNACSPKY